MSEYDEMVKLIELLRSEGFTDGFAFHGTDLVLWEHDEDPPKPLTRPKA